MLRQIREKTGSFFVKLILGILVISFAAWGVGDMITYKGQTQAVASVGSVEITRNQVEDEVRREIARLNPQFGNRLTPETALMLGLHRSILGRMINETVLLEEARDQGLAVSDNSVRDQVHNNPLFRSELGAGGFDRDRFQQILYQNNLTERQYLDEMRREILRSQLIDSLASGVAAPDAFVKAVYKFREEKRIAVSLFINDSAAQITAEPTEEELKTFHKDHAARFTAPEYRAVTLILLRAADLAGGIKVTDEQVAKAFEEQADSLGVPEKRKLQQMFLPDKAAAEKARAALAEGREFVTVATELAGMDAAGTELGTVAKDDVLEEIADAAFAAPAGAVTDPIAGPGGIGYYLVKVVSIEPGRAAKLEDIREDLRQRLAKEKAVDALYTLVNKLEDEVGRGSSLEEAARVLNLKTARIEAMDAEGQAPDGSRPAALPEGADTIVAAAFETQQGADSTIRELGDEAFFLLRVDGVTPPALKPFETVTEQVKAALIAERRRDATLAFAKVVADRLKAGEDAQAVAKDVGGVFAETKPLKRYYPPNLSEIPGQLLQDIFALAPDGAAVTRGDGGYYVSRLKQVIPADPAADPQGIEAARRELTAQAREDVLTQMASALGKQAGVKINEEAFRQVLSPGAAPQAN